MSKSTKSFNLIVTAKKNYQKMMVEKIDNPFKVPKTYRSILSNFLGKRKTANITPLIVNDFVVSDFSTKTNLLNNFFTSQGSPVVNYSTVPETDLEGGAGGVRPFFCYHFVLRSL